MSAPTGDGAGTETVTVEEVYYALTPMERTYTSREHVVAVLLARQSVLASRRAALAARPGAGR